LFAFSGTTLFYFSSIVYFLVVYHSWRQFKERGWIDGVHQARFRDGRFVRFASGAFMHSLAGVAVTSWDKAYTATVLSAHDFSIYIVGAQYAAGLVLIYTAISQAVVPQVYALLSKEQGKAAACGRYFLMMGAVFFLLFVLFEIAIGELMRISFPVTFHAAIPIAQMLGVAALLQGLYFLSSSVLFYYHRTFSLAAITMTCGVFGAIIAAVTGASDSASVASITIWVWGAFFSLTTVYSGYLVIKND
jgi:O-antigen/teichoic acid export membrane protein